MKFKYLLYLLLLSCPIICSGCFSKGEINSIALVRGLGIDQSDNGYIVTIQVINPSQLKNLTDITPISLYSVTDQTILKALRRISTTASRRLYIGHLGLVVVGEAQARAGIIRLLDFLLRDHESRITFHWIIARGTTAQNVLSILTPMESIPVQRVINTLEKSEKIFATTKIIQTYQLVNQITSMSASLVLPVVSATGNHAAQYELDSLKSTHTESRLYVKELAAFRGDRLIGWLDETESKGYNYITNNITNPVETLYMKKEKAKIAIEITESKTKLQGRMRAGRPEITVNLSVKGVVGEIEGDYNISLLANLVRLEAALQIELTRQMQASVHHAINKLKLDVFGFGEAIHRADPKAWKKLKNNWASHLPQLTINYQVKPKLLSTGLITKPYWRKPEKE